MRRTVGARKELARQGTTAARGGALLNGLPKYTYRASSYSVQDFTFFSSNKLLLTTANCHLKTDNRLVYL